MRIIKRATLERYAAKYAAARPHIANWVDMASAASWRNRAHLEQSATGVDHFVDGTEGPRVIFKIKHNDFRLIVGIRYADPPLGKGLLYIKFFGTHAEYDRIDPSTVEP